MRPLTHLSSSLPRHLSTVTPLQYVNYFQCLILLYFFTFSVYYHEKYAKIDNCHVASAILDHKSMQLTMVFVFGDVSWRRELFFVDSAGNETLVQLTRPALVASPEIMMWSSGIESADGIFVHAEHPKSAYLELETGKPKLEIFPQEPYQEPHEVVTCMTPVTDDLELFLTALTTSISMGSFVHLPYSDLPGELYKFVRIFEKSRNVRLLAHPLLRDFEQNHRNPSKIERIRADLAQLHCYLMYRAAAKFVIFQSSAEPILPVSMDPRGEIITYQSHFSSIFQLPRVDGYAVLEYNARIHVAQNNAEFSDFSIQSALGEAKVEVLNRNSGCFVVKTDTPFSASRGTLYTLRNVSPNSKISAKILESVDKTIDVVEESDVFWTLLKSCPSRRGSGGCASGKCIRPSVRHRSLQGWYSYDIHFSQFISLDSFHC